MFLITELTQGTMGNGIREEASFPHSLSFPPYLIFPSASFPSFKHPSIRLASSARAANSSTEQEKERERERTDRGRKV